MNQIELHPLVYKARLSLLQYCNSQKIVTTAYGSLFSGQTQYLQAEEIKRVSQDHTRFSGPTKRQVTASQVLLRWALQKGLHLIPKSVHADRIKENMQIYDIWIDTAGMELLEGMKGYERGNYSPADHSYVQLSPGRGRRAGGSEPRNRCAQQLYLPITYC